MIYEDTRIVWLLKSFMALLTLAAVIGLAGCASSSMQWWRVGNCVVVYDTRDDNRQILVAGQQCDIKREELPVVTGRVR